MYSNERETALGKREVLTSELRKIMLKAGIYVKEIHDITNPVLNKDLLDMDLETAKVMLDDLVKSQRLAKAKVAQIKEINKVYNFEGEFDE
jgi:hypothetical protein